MSTVHKHWSIQKSAARRGKGWDYPHENIDSLGVAASSKVS